MTEAPYPDAAAPTADRVADLLGRMTLLEKLGQLVQLDAQGDLDDVVVTKLAGSILHVEPDRVKRAIELARTTRLGIPLLIADDCIHGHSFWPGATIFPTQLGMACSWNPSLVRRAARITAVEATSTGFRWTFSPVVCIARELRWGRVGETFGEDMLLIGDLASAMVQGYQGEGLSDPTSMLATAKHFAGYSETQGGRDASEADLSRRKLRSWFLPPFERVVRAGCRTVMIGYQATDGVPITASRWLLDGVLKQEWGFAGVLVTDWDNVGRMVWEQKVCADYAEASARAVNAGNDLIMTTPKFLEGAQEALQRGLLTEDAIDAAVARVLTLKFDLGLFEDPAGPDEQRQREVIGCAEHTAANLEIARRSLVLLRNDGILPLVGATGTVAVIGPNADDPDATLGDWAGSSGQALWLAEGVAHPYTTTVLAGMRQVAAESGWTVTATKGCDIAELGPHPDGPLGPDMQPAPPFAYPIPADPAELERAAALAESADATVVVLGDIVALAGEVRSSATLELIGGQIALLDRLIATGRPVILVLINTKPLVLPPSAAKAAAIIEAFNPGAQGGRAVAELIFGLIEPAGRLPISFPKHVGQQPSYYYQVRGQHGWRYVDLDQEPAFAFGEGLSYTTVEYADLRLDRPEYSRTDVIEATVTVRNTGQRPALETVQLYIRDLVTSVTWADRELKSYQQVELAAGSAQDVTLRVPVSDCTIVDADGNRIVEAGEFEVLVGPDSRPRNLLAARCSVTA